MASKESNNYSAPMVYKSFAILKEIAKAQGTFGVSDISRLLNFNKSTVYGVTQAFLDLGVLCQDESTKKFRLGPALLQLGNQALASVSLRSIARPYMIRLARDFVGTVFLGCFDEDGITIIEKADSPVELKISAPIGTRLPFFAGSPAKSYLANLDEDSQKKIIMERNLPKFTENTIDDVDEYLVDLQQVRKQGYATDFEEYIHGVNAVSVALLDKRGMFLAAIYIVGFSNSFTEDKMRLAAEAAKESAREITEFVG
ncbi:MAG: IclR family transcriptional regulator [Desulfosporosinus sp.]